MAGASWLRRATGSCGDARRLRGTVPGPLPLAPPRIPIELAPQRRLSPSRRGPLSRRMAKGMRGDAPAERAAGAQGNAIETFCVAV